MPAHSWAGLCLLAACGARSGLRDAPPDAPAAPDVLDVAPDVPPDVPPDRAPDAPPPECALDADCDDGVRCTRDRCDVAAGRCVREAVDALCDDGRFCNGAERCAGAAGCLPGAAPACTDAVACTRDRCDDALNRCAPAPDDALCPISHRCDATRGCVARALANTAGQLYEVELPSGALRPIGPLRPFTDVALHPDRTLYAVTSLGDLWRVDPATGASAFVARTGQDFTAFDAAPDGGLYGAGRAGLFRVDPASGRATPVAPFPPGLEASGDIAFLGARLLATARPGFNLPDQLVEFDVAAGSARVLGPLGYPCVWGLAAFGATLYGLTCAGIVISVDPSTGRGRELARGAAVFYGATAR